MEKIEYIKSSFDNIQQLIQFADQKVAAVLVVISITIGLFFSQLTDLTLIFKNFSFLNFLLFLLGFLFLILNINMLYIALIKIIRPNFAGNYNENDYSIYYFGHISKNGKIKLEEKLSNLNDVLMLCELKDQLFEVSKILNKKNENCHFLINLLFASIIILCLFVSIKNII